MFMSCLFSAGLHVKIVKITCLNSELYVYQILNCVTLIKKKFEITSERAVALASGRDVNPSNMKLAEGCYERACQLQNNGLLASQEQKKKSEVSRATSLVFITASRQSHIVRNDFTPGGHSKLKTHNAVF